MKVTTAMILIASMASHAYASGNLRSAAADVDADEELDEGVVGALLRMKDNPNHRFLEDGSNAITSVTNEEKKKQATREKLQEKKSSIVTEKQPISIVAKSNPEDATAEHTTNDADVRIAATREKLHQTRPYLKKQMKKTTVEPSPEDAEYTTNAVGVRIVGGEQSDFNEFPYYVDMNGCGGTLIGPNIVLSAAHCGGYLGQSVKIGGTRYTVTDQRRHPNYNGNTIENDFYLYKLRSAVTTSGARVTLNTNAATPSAGQTLTILGLGQRPGA